MSIITFKYRTKNSGVNRLVRYAMRCNQVWNFCVATQLESQRRWAGDKRVRWPSAFDLIKLCTGASTGLGIHSDTINEICRRFVQNRDKAKKCPKFRSSFGAKRALGWVPFVSRAVRVDGDAAVYLGTRYRFWKSREIYGAFKSGAFVQDARGRWYVTFGCEVADDLPRGDGQIGIDLGLKALATCSDGVIIPALQHYRQYEARLATAQRARRKTRVAAIHAKIANARRYHLHVASTELAQQNSVIVVGNVNASALVKTKMAKSILDAGWSTFRNMLRYKAARRQATYVEADERWTSQVCSCCGTIPASSPKGMGGLGMRQWVCSGCGASHDRDVNAARNILRVGLECQAPAGGISSNDPITHNSST